jgi:hypothetical protein
MSTTATTAVGVTHSLLMRRVEIATRALIDQFHRQREFAIVRRDSEHLDKHTLTGSDDICSLLDTTIAELRDVDKTVL